MYRLLIDKPLPEHPLGPQTLRLPRWAYYEPSEWVAMALMEAIQGRKAEFIPDGL